MGRTTLPVIDTFAHLQNFQHIDDLDLHSNGSGKKVHPPRLQIGRPKQTPNIPLSV